MTTAKKRSSAKTGLVAPKPASSIDKPVVRFRMRITLGDVISVGPGKIALLEAIQQTRSITAAAKSLEMSYRRAWILVDELNASLKQPAVRSATGGERGGGSELTEVGEKLIDLYRRIETRASESCAAEIRNLLKLLAKAP